MLLYLLIVWQCGPTVAVHESVAHVSQTLQSLDDKISKTLKEMPRKQGEYLVEIMKDYNSKLLELEKFLTEQRSKILECLEATDLLREGAPDYFAVNIDRDTAMVNFGWIDKGLDEVFQQRATSIVIWTRINRRSRLIPLEFYTYPENSTYIGYESPIFPPLKEKLTKN